MFLVSDEFQSYMSTPENRVSTCVNKKSVSTGTLVTTGMRRR